MTKVKICGLQEPEHVRAAVEAGADAIGFVFAKSKRQVTVAQAQQLAQHIPRNVLIVGVFVDETVEVMQQIAKTVPLDVIQLHGQETNAVIQQLSYPTIKAVGVRTAADVEALQAFESDYVLVDAPVAGSGETFDWNLLTTRYPQLILAGGLSIDNIAEALTCVAPYMVDVSSGVETNGVKDTAKISAFITAVKNGENA
ncbi:N-(5'-phosphoribosyl)anthranilate isomerase [Kurthia sp. 3B1D]|uniref:N-(5'-phosphoribosyl)anthranilate isomerase n=1 Tax=Candidatus Kurthia intestinigallinarum TaxID=1562256 RepID=A0A433RV47_9BACL|nr:phosphoribosylanthranilate isomerase [Kurthia sp. 3B1D]RUS57154.1 N-(5'-phosphoribosyl)anthranilate isomerase [Kurthia sp. 3B1D]